VQVLAVSVVEEPVVATARLPLVRQTWVVAEVAVLEQVLPEDLE
jgi:hypothetical protein